MGCGRSPKVRVCFWMPPKGISEVAGAAAGAHGTARPATVPHCILLSSTCFMLLSAFPPYFRVWGGAGSPGCGWRSAGRWGFTGSGVPWGRGPMSFMGRLQCQPAAARWLLAGAILSLDRWASARVWVTATGGMLGGGLRAGKSRWDFSGDSPILPPPPPSPPKGFNDADVFLVSFPMGVAV